MRYLITAKGHPPGLTNWFDVENNWNDDVAMVVYDLHLSKYMDDGILWKDIEEDHL